MCRDEGFPGCCLPSEQRGPEEMLSARTLLLFLESFLL